MFSLRAALVTAPDVQPLLWTERLMVSSLTHVSGISFLDEVPREQNEEYIMLSNQQEDERLGTDEREKWVEMLELSFWYTLYIRESLGRNQITFSTRVWGSYQQTNLT